MQQKQHRKRERENALDATFPNLSQENSQPPAAR